MLICTIILRGFRYPPLPVYTAALSSRTQPLSHRYNTQSQRQQKLTSSLRIKKLPHKLIPPNVHLSIPSKLNQNHNNKSICYLIIKNLTAEILIGDSIIWPNSDSFSLRHFFFFFWLNADMKIVRRFFIRKRSERITKGCPPPRSAYHLGTHFCLR